MLAAKQEVGKLDKRLTIQQKVVGDNISNEDAEEGWEDFTFVWCSIDDKRGDETYRADKLTAYEDAVITMRYRDDVIPEMRGLCDGFIYNFLSVSRVGRKRFLSISAQTGGEYQES